MNGSRAEIEKLRSSGVVKLKGDNLFALWVKTACCNLTSNQLRGVADISDKYGRGFFLFSTRQIPIVPFVHLNDVEKAKEELSKVELQLDRCGPTVRNVNVCYGEKICPLAITSSTSLGEKLDNFFDVPSLNKIKIGAAGCKKDCIVSRVLNDVSFIGVEMNGVKGYDAFVGGRLGVNPFIGLKMADCLSEKRCLKFVQNYFELIGKEGKKGERGADLIKRLGFEKVKDELNKELESGINFKPIECSSNLIENQAGKIILRIRANCGEVTSKQARKIADISEKYGKGFVHFPIRGSPEIPCIEIKNVETIRNELDGVGLKLIEGGIENIQTCFGDYCTESVADTQTLLRKIEGIVEEIGLNNPEIAVSGAGCPNSCGIAHLNDIGFYGAVEPWIDSMICSGCGLCATICKRKAIEIKNGIAAIDLEKCKNCGQCISVCPLNAIIAKRKGFSILVGGKVGEKARLGEIIAKFASEDEALGVARKCLVLLKEKNCGAAEVIDEIGLGKFREILFSKA